MGHNVISAEKKAEEIKELFTLFEEEVHAQEFYLKRIALLNDAGYLDQKSRRTLARSIYRHGADSSDWLMTYAREEYDYIMSRLARRSAIS